MVDVFMVYSKEDLDEARSLLDFLEAPSRDGERHIRVHILNVDRNDVDMDWHDDAREFIQRSVAVVYLQGKKAGRNVLWELKTAFDMRTPVMVCRSKDAGASLGWIAETAERSKRAKSFKLEMTYTWLIARYAKWIKEIRIPRAKIMSEKVVRSNVYTREDIKARLISFDTKIYEIFSPAARKKVEAGGTLSSDEIERLFEQYKMYQETAQKVEDRKLSVNQFYLTIDTALMTFVGAVFGLVKIPNINRFFVLLIVAFTGAIFNYSWRRTLDAYQILNRGKMRLINSIERQLPLRLFDMEYRIMNDELNPWEYVSTTDAERILPTLFGVLYFFLAFISLFVPVAVE